MLHHLKCSIRQTVSEMKKGMLLAGRSGRFMSFWMKTRKVHEWPDSAGLLRDRSNEKKRGSVLCAEVAGSWTPGSFRNEPRTVVFRCDIVLNVRLSGLYCKTALLIHPWM
jgi:hypothetical protein